MFYEPLSNQYEVLGLESECTLPNVSEMSKIVRK